ncbi:DNA polymerase III subunit alpha [Candidatus Uhrbacteria bacterium]|nr:DNA polymerase III subunit alpha [Candidatus Uhrbacteria bacterium]
MAQSFVHLHVHSHYSLLDGLTRLDELVAAAKADGQPAVALTDHGAMYGAIEFYKVATKAGVKPILGIEAYLAPRSRHDRERQPGERAYTHIVLLAKNRLGYQNLLQLTTRAHLEGFYYKPRIDWELLEQFGEGLIVLSGCLSGEIPHLIREGRRDEADAAVRRYRERFGEDFYLEMQHRSEGSEQAKVNAALVELGRRHGVPLVATNDVHYLQPADAEAQDVLLCLQTKAKQSDRDRMTMLGENYSLRSAHEMALLFSEHPDAIERTLEIAAKCDCQLELGKILLPRFALPAGATNESHLRELCVDGLTKRYATDALRGRATERLEYELGVIAQMGLSSYFLIVQDFVNWAKGQGIVVGPGRGSAAGSIVSYLTNITNLDPLAYDLLFERFLAPGRIQMPDIDIDFADHRRDEVIRYVQSKYGEDCVAQIITFGTMAARASVRDVGRVLDIPLQFCDRLAKLIPMQASLEEALRDIPELQELAAADETTQRLFAIGQRLEGASRHTSTHACGVVIAAEPLVRNTPIQRASADDATIVTQYEMHAVEALGLLKMDFLGLSNLSIMEHAVHMIRARGGAINLEQLPLDDGPTYALLQRGETTGVFQLESGGMKRYLKELKPSQFEDIIAMVALYRPGPMELIPEYIDRKFGRKPVEYLLPALEPILRNTYGIMVYQEQLMQLARVLGGFSMSEADTLRKAVGKKIKSLLDEQREKLIAGMIRNGIGPKVAAKIWEWIEPFARYGFNRSHAACYALIAYQTAYLKAHFAPEFMAALLTAERGNTDRLTILIQECREMGMTVLGPEVNESAQLFTVVDRAAMGPAIRFGLAAIKNVGEHLVEAIVRERDAHGRFRDLEDFLARMEDKDFNKKSLESLIQAGTLDAFGERGQLLANIDALLAHHRAVTRDRAAGQENLFGMMGVANALRLAPADAAPQRLRLSWERELLGFYLTAHPFAATSQLLGATVVPIAEVKRGGRSDVVIGGAMTRVKRIVTKNGEAMLFAELEDATGAIEVVVFPRVLTATPQVWLAETLALVRGKCSEKDGTPKILADHAVQVLPGRERDALGAIGVRPAPGVPGAREQRRLLIQLPATFSQDRLPALRDLLLRFPGSMSVRLRVANGSVVSTGCSVACTGDFRDAVTALVGVDCCTEESVAGAPAQATG